MPKTASNPLADRLAALQISAEDLAAVVNVAVEEVEDWIENGPTAHAEVLLRFLAGDADALRRVNHARRSYQGDMRGAGMTYAGIEGVPYGTADAGKVTGGVPS